MNYVQKVKKMICVNEFVEVWTVFTACLQTCSERTLGLTSTGLEFIQLHYNAKKGTQIFSFILHCTVELLESIYDTHREKNVTGRIMSEFLHR